MSWKGTAPPHFGGSGSSSSNVPDYQKMLQHHILSSGWGNSARQATSDRYRVTSYAVSPPRTASPPLTSHTRPSESLNYRDTNLYQPYQPSKYGLSSTNNHYDVSYRNYNDLTLEETVHALNEDGIEKTVAYAPTSYDFQKFDSDTYKPGGKLTYGLSSQRSAKTSDFDLERPTTSDTDLNWTSPPKSATLDYGLSGLPAGSRSSVTEAVDYGRDRQTGRGLGQTSKSSVDDLYTQKHYIENGDAHIAERPPRPQSKPSHNDFKSHTVDLAHWQRHHKDQLVQQQVEKEGLYGNSSRFDRLFNNLSDTEDNPSKWNSVKQAADAIISEKDTMIDKLKLQIMHLEESNKQYEAKLRRALINESDQETEAYSQIKGLEIKNTSLKAELMELKSKKDAEKEDLEIKLGAVEHEVVELRTALRKRVPHFDDDVHFKVDHLENEKDEWKNRFLEMKDSYHKLKQQLDELQRYISDFPTPEEAAQQEEELQNLREENKSQDSRIAELEQKLFDNKKLLSSRETEIKGLEEKRLQLDEKVTALTDNIYHIKTVGQGAVLQQKEEELSVALEENKKLSVDLDKAKKLLETGHKKIRQQEVRNQNTVRQLEERLSQEEEMVNALREEAKVKDDHMLKIKKSHKHLASQNQDLMEQNLVLREQVKHFEEQTTDENQRLQRQFMQELGICFSELQALVQICMQRAEGQDPNMSMLLGVRAPPVELEGSASAKSEAQTIKQWLSKIKDLKGEVESLRGTICNKYAEDMGDNFNCTTQ